MKINKRNFNKIVNFKQIINLQKGTHLYCVPKHKSKRVNDKTGTFGVHVYIRRDNKYIYLKDKEETIWALENDFAGESGRKGLFPYYDEENKPFNWNYEYILKIKEEDYKDIPKKKKLKQEIVKKYSVSGTWSKEESELFAIQFFKFGNKWKDYSILTSRGIRKTSQVRSYAQKHSSKIKEDEVLKSASILHLLKNN